MTDKEAHEALLQRIRDERIQLRRDIAHYRNWKFYPVDVPEVVTLGRDRQLKRLRRMALCAWVFALTVFVVALKWF